MESRRLSTRQNQILDFVRHYMREHAYPPTVREIGDGVGISSTSVVDYNLKALAKRGYIRRDADISRGIEMLDEDGQIEPIDAAERVSVPVMGQIAAGAPIEAIEGHREYVTLTKDLVPNERVYGLRVRGKSMIEDLIDDNDIVVVRAQTTADNGDTVVALLTNGVPEAGEATLKRYYREPNGLIRLQPANSTMEPLFVEEQDLRIQGKVISVIREV